MRCSSRIRCSTAWKRNSLKKLGCLPPPELPPISESFTESEEPPDADTLLLQKAQDSSGQPRPSPPPLGPRLQQSYCSGLAGEAPGPALSVWRPGKAASNRSVSERLFPTSQGPSTTAARHGLQRSQQTPHSTSEAEERLGGGTLATEAHEGDSSDTSLSVAWTLTCRAGNHTQNPLTPSSS